MTPLGGKAPPTEQADLVALPVVLHEELVPSTDVLIEVPWNVEWADRRVIRNRYRTMRLPGLRSWLPTPTTDSRLRVSRTFRCRAAPTKVRICEEVGLERECWT